MPRARFAKLPHDKQSEILEVAAREFAEHGYDGASLNKIIERAGISKGAAYYYFDGKEDLFATVIDAAFERVMGAVGGGEDLAGHDDFWEGVARLFRRMSQFLFEDRELAGLVRALQSMSRHSSSHVLADLYEQAVELTDAILKVGQERGEVRTDLPFDLLSGALASVFQALDKWAISHWNEIDEAALDRITDVGVDLFKRLAMPAPQESGA